MNAILKVIAVSFITICLLDQELRTSEPPRLRELMAVEKWGWVPRVGQRWVLAHWAGGLLLTAG